MQALHQLNRMGAWLEAIVVPPHEASQHWQQPAVLRVIVEQAALQAVGGPARSRVLWAREGADV